MSLLHASCAVLCRVPFRPSPAGIHDVHPYVRNMVEYLSPSLYLVGSISLLLPCIYYLLLFTAY
ncbi:uncharacterized protein BDW47DRAFT_108122 [Aspergillus candidus]|uniref:Uncharacterized protein n=1 Tax=Aspergillus candidus TaxID=41067 RepID=A0A2I2F880_ASPCN|nr:hypothetical protein BDW47DRAFT_108122 [Aspergillus candidus]PLB36837.1 hypothetical protein BDW47DRAFT_108122 [Aspergillus candidus]